MSSRWRQWSSLLALACLLSVLVTASADVFSPYVAPSRGESILLLATNSGAPSPKHKRHADAAEAMPEQRADPHGAVAILRIGDADSSAQYALFVSRVVEAAVLGDPALQAFALRYSNGSVELGTPTSLNGDFIYSSEWLQGPYVAMANGQSHLCLLLESGFVDCRVAAAPVSGFNVSSGVLMGHRSGVRFTQIVAANSFTCALRADDSKVECYGDVASNWLETPPPAVRMTLNSSSLQYSAIAAQYAGGWCGLTLDQAGRDLYCWSVSDPTETLALAAPTAPLFWRAPFWSSEQTGGCALRNDGRFSCNYSDGSLFTPDPSLQTAVVSDLTSWGLLLRGVVATRGSLLDYVSSSAIESETDFLFAPARFIGIDAAQGDDSRCAAANTLSPAELLAFVPCATFAGAVRALTRRNTWIQFLPGTHIGGSQTIEVDVTLSSEPPSFLSASELASVGNGSWVRRMAESSAVSSSVVLDCSGFVHCVVFNFLRVSLHGIAFTGSSEHALEHHFLFSDQPPAPDLIMSNCNFSHVGGMLIKTNGFATISGCSIVDSTPAEAVHALVDFTEVDATISNCLFARNYFLDSDPVATALRSCVRIFGSANRIVHLDDCTFDDNHASAPWTTDDPPPTVLGGVAVQIKASYITVRLNQCTFKNQTTSGTSVYGGAVGLFTFDATMSVLQVTLNVDSCWFLFCSVLSSPTYGGGGGSLAVSEEDPTNNLPNSLALSLGAIVTIMGCVFRDGAAAAGGAVLLGTLTRLDLETVEVARCRATQGGAVAVIQSPRRLLFVQRTIRLYDFQFHDNSADSVGGAIVLRSVIAAVDIGTSMIWNTQAQFGGAIFVHGGQINTIQYVSFENTVATVEGGAVFVRSTQNVAFEGCSFIGATATTLGGAIGSKFSNLDFSEVTFTGCGLVESAALQAGTARSGGAIHFVGGEMYVQRTSFENCYAIPPTMPLSACAVSHDAASGLNSDGIGGAINLELSGIALSDVTVSQGRACSGGFLSVNGAGPEDLIDLRTISAVGMEAWSGSVLAIRGATMVAVTELRVNHSVARSNGGAIVFTENADVSVFDSAFHNVSCTPLTPGAGCDGGALWMTSPRKFRSLTMSTSFTDVRAAGAGAISFQSASSVAADALATVLPFEDLGSSDSGNTFTQTASLPPLFQYGPIRASSVVNLTATTQSLQIYPGQLFDGSLPTVAIVTVDAFGQACTMDRSLVVAIEAIGAESASVTFAGTTLQKVQAASGAANFSSGDLRISAPPGDYTLRFSVVSLPDLSIDVALSVTDSCPAGLFYSVGLRSCVSCPSDLVVYNSTLNACEQCMAGWQRAAPSAAAANATGGPLNDGVFCEVCPLGSVSTSGSRCAPCPPNTYQPTAFAACVQCSEIAGLQCAGDGLAQVEAGYFALSVPDGAGGSLIETFQCPEGFCSAARVQVPTATAVSANLASGPPSSSSAVNSYEQCAFPRLASPTNLLCGECAEGYRPWGNRCSRCDSVDGGLVFGLIVLSLVLLAWLIRSSLGSPSAGHAVVVLYFVQTAMLELGSLNSLLAWLNVVLLSPNSVGRCVAPLSPYQQTQAQILMPVALWIELCIIALIHFVAFKRWGALSAREGAVSSAASLPARLRASALDFVSRFSVDLYVSATLSLLLFSYTQVAVACVTYLRCVSVGGTAVVFSQPTMRCESDEYAQTRGLVVFALIAYVAGLPMGIAAFLWRRSDAVREAHAALAAQAQDGRIVSASITSESSDGNAFTSAAVPASSSAASPAVAATSASSSRFLRRYAPLFAMYSSSAWFWQVLVLCRRTAFVVISVLLLPTPRRRFVAFALSTLVSSLLQLVFAPFRLSVFNRVELGSQSLLLVLSITLTLEDPPFSAGVEAFIFLLVVVPLCVYALWAAGATIVGAKLDRDRVYAAKEQEQLELESAIDAGLTRNPSIALHARPEVGVEMLSPSAVSSDDGRALDRSQL